MVYRVPVKAYSMDHSRWTTKYKSIRTAVLGLHVVSWNVDFMAPDTAGRVTAVIDHLRRKVLHETPQPSCILLQELDHSSFAAILSNDWVRKHYAVTPPDMRRWATGYGVATLVSRHMNILSASMMQFSGSSMGRTALFVDVELAMPEPLGLRDRRVLRIANTHLESLPIGAGQRPLQLRAIASFLRAPGIDAGLVAGDMNVIAPADESIHIFANLEDACTDESEKAFTWGYQPRSRYPPGRLDRMFSVPGTLDYASPLEVIGKGVKTPRGMWASDHYGLKAHVKLPFDSDEDSAQPAGKRRRWF